MNPDERYKELQLPRDINAGRCLDRYQLTAHQQLTFPHVVRGGINFTIVLMQQPHMMCFGPILRLAGVSKCHHEPQQNHSKTCSAPVPLSKKFLSKFDSAAVNMLKSSKKHVICSSLGIHLIICTIRSQIMSK